MTLVHRRELSPIQPFMLSAKQGGIGSHFLTIFGLTGPGIKPQCPVWRADTLQLRHHLVLVISYFKNLPDLQTPPALEQQTSDLERQPKQS